MKAINDLMEGFGYTLISTKARYGGGMIVLLAFSEEKAYDFIDRFSSGDQIAAEADEFVSTNEDYPFAFGNDLPSALLALEQKLLTIPEEHRTGHDAEPWRNSTALRLCMFLSTGTIKYVPLPC